MSAIPGRKRPMGKNTKGSGRKVVLEKVIGNTIVHNSSFACNPITGDLAYPAGCVVVIYSPKKNKQIKFLTNKENKAISFLKYSLNGKYLAVGESGHRPAVYVWDTSTWAIVSELRGHKFGVSCGCFSPNGKYLVTVGFQHDGTVFVWDWKAGTAAASNKVTTKVYAVSYSEDGAYFVTAGFRHVKFWHMDTIAAKPADKGKTPSQTAVIEGRAGVLGTNRDCVYLDVACGTGPSAAFTFCVTSKGLICQFGPNRSMDRWVNLKADRVFGLALSQDIVACACSDGIVRLFSAMDLSYLQTIPKPHAIGKEDAGPGNSPNDVYPDALAVQLSSDSQRLSIVYTDRSLLLWDLRNPKKAGFLRAFLAHCACIWDIAIPPSTGVLPEGSFVTCGADNTIRVWNLDAPSLTSSVSASISVDASISSLQKQYNKDIVRTIHTVNGDTSAFKAKDNIDLRTSSEMLPSVSNDTGIRCLAMTTDGKQLAAGDRQGNLRVYNLPSYECAAVKEVHDAEILSLDYSSPSARPSDVTSTSHTLLATASRDRLVHVLDASKGYDLVSTLDDHSSSITSVKFAVGSTRLLTCSADKSIIFRSVEQNSNSAPSIKRYHQAVVTYGTLYDMDVDPTQKYIVSTGQDKKLSIYTINQPKVIRSYKADGEAGEVLKVSLDPAGIYAATSCADKVMRVYDFYSGECLAKMTGHSELVTGIKFTRDCRRIISVAGDGCIFVWKLSQDFTKSMKDRLAERNPSASSPTSANGSPSQLPLSAATPVFQGQNVPTVSPITSGKNYTPSPDTSAYDFRPVPHGNEFFGFNHGDASSDVSMNDSILPKFKFSETALPSWAKNDKGAPKEDKPPPKEEKGGVGAKGRWAQRIEGNEGYALYSDLGDEDKPVVKPTDKGRRYTIEPDLSTVGDKWASPSSREPRDAKNAKDLLVSDMESSARIASKAMEDTDMVLTDHIDFESDPRMRASQIGGLEDDSDEEMGIEEEKSEEEKEKEEKEEEKEDEEEKEEPIYMEGDDSSKGFEVDTQPIASTDKTPTKQEEEEEFEDPALQDISAIKESDEYEGEDEEFKKLYDKYDFIKSNFENLSAPRESLAQNPMRLSISRKFLAEQPVQPAHSKEKEEKAAPTLSGGSTSTEDSKTKKVSKEPLANEVLKTRERLAKMGIVLPSAQATLKGDSTMSPSNTQQASTTSPTAPSSTAVTSPTSVHASKTSPSSSALPANSPPLSRVESSPPIPRDVSPSHTLSSTTVRTSPSSTSQFNSTLRRPLAEYESAINSLTASLNHTLQMWKEVRESPASDPTASHLSQQFQSLFSAISGQIAQVDPSVTTTFSQSTRQPLGETTAPSQDPLDKISDALVAKLIQKLDTAEVQNRLLQSLTSSMKSSFS